MTSNAATTAASTPRRIIVSIADRRLVNPGETLGFVRDVPGSTQFVQRHERAAWAENVSVAP